MGICTKCGRNVSGGCTVCYPPGSGTGTGYSKSPNKKSKFLIRAYFLNLLSSCTEKLKLGKYIGKAKKINPLGKATVSPSYNQPPQPTPNRPSLPPVCNADYWKIN